jgi:FAD/FMN-containing dehydrogenase
VLRLAAGAGAVALTSCTSSKPPSPPPTSQPGPTTGSSAPTSGAAAPDWSRLASRLRGDLVRPGDAGYGRARELFNPRFDQVRPMAVAYCSTTSDVAASILFARDAGVPLALRAGGHSYAGWSTSTGLVVDVSRIAAVQVSGASAAVGAGARLIDVYDGVAARGMALPAGSCPTVGVAGLTLGGGQGVLSRAWGLTCDSLTGLDAVTADGRVVSADPQHEPDLYWACRGGGGGSFAVVTRLRLRLRPQRQVTTWYYRWDYRVAADVLAGWQRWASTAPREMWSTCKLLTRPGESSPSAQVSGTWLGDPAGLGRELSRVVDAVGHTPVGSARATRGFLATMLAEAGCSTVPAARCSTPRTTFGATSHVLETAAPAAAVATAVDAVARRHRGGYPRQSGVSFDVLGGAVADLAPADTAFPHRRALAVAQYTVGWPQGQAEGAVRRDLRWLHGFRAAMTPYVGNSAYVNYADPTLADWQSAYFGGNYPRLQQVKRRYDPDDVFRFAQSVQGA